MRLLQLQQQNRGGGKNAKLLQGHELNGEDGKSSTSLKNKSLNGMRPEDSEWKDCLTEAAAMLSPKQLRDLFVYILHHNQPASPLHLWSF
jgi:hypothetical protein